MKRGRVIVAAVVILGALGWVAFRGLSGNLVYYTTPTELLAKGDVAVAERVRLGGLVIPGTARDAGSSIEFVVTDETSRMTVIATGGVPALFREGQGVVLEGFYGRDGRFHADTVLVKHGSVYRPPAPGQTPTSADLEDS